MDVRIAGRDGAVCVIPSQSETAVVHHTPIMYWPPYSRRSAGQLLKRSYTSASLRKKKNIPAHLWNNLKNITKLEEMETQESCRFSATSVKPQAKVK